MVPLQSLAQAEARALAGETDDDSQESQMIVAKYVQKSGIGQVRRSSPCPWRRCCGAGLSLSLSLSPHHRADLTPPATGKTSSSPRPGSAPLAEPPPPLPRQRDPGNRTRGARAPRERALHGGTIGGMGEVRGRA